MMPTPSAPQPAYLDLADVTTVIVDLQNTSATGITGSFSNVENFVAGQPTNPVRGTY